MHVCIAQNVRFMYNVIEDKAYVRHSVQQVRCLQEKQKDTGELVLIILPGPLFNGFLIAAQKKK